MFVVAFTNQLSDNKYLFFYEFDHVDLFDVLEEANFISEVAGIDMDVNVSSLNCYHLLSFDILTREETIRAQRFVSLEVGHYLNLDEVFLFRAVAEANRLRLGEKFSKPPPYFLKRFLNNTRHWKSRRHWVLANFYYGTPDFDMNARFATRYKARVCIYKTGIGIKHWGHFEDPRLRRLEIKKCDRKV